MPPDAQSPLENLLLLQALHPFQANPPPFGSISDTLKTSDLLRQTDSFAQNRLEPEALQDQYLKLLNEEVSTESDRGQSPQKDGSSPRKRKRSIPPLETVDEASQYRHLLPKLVNRLYFKFRDHAVKSMEEEERRYKTLQREIQEIERGDWDACLNQESTSRRESRGVSSIQTILRHDDDHERDTGYSGTHSGPISSHAPQDGVDAVTRARAHSPVPNGVHQRPSSTGPQPSPIDQRQIQQPSPAESSVPYLPPPQPVNNGYTMGSPSLDIHRRLPPPHQLQSHSAPSPSAYSAHNPPPAAERSSASPIILPPPPGMLRSSGSPAGPLDTLADMAGQQYRASPAMPPSRAMHHSGAQPPHQLPQPRNYMPRGYPYYENQSPYQVPYSSYNPTPLPPAKYQHQPGVASFPSNVMSPGQGPPYSNVPPYHPSMPPYPPQHSGYNHSHGYYQQPPSQPSYVRGRVPQHSEQHTPMSTVSGKERPPKPSPIATPASSTKWKNVDTPGTFRQRSPKSPSPGAISPISPKAPSPQPELPQPQARASPEEEDQQNTTHATTQKPRRKPSRGRGTGRRGRGGRAASATSSVHDESTTARTRSESVLSQADELLADQPASTRKIKPEPHALSFNDDEASAASYTADESSRRSNRQRRGTNHSLERLESNRPSSKRKREESSARPPASPAGTAPSKPGYILGTRNFPKISAPLMSDISTHKLGSLFAKPLTEREAPGYKDLIYRPQDLRSIKNAINAGGKALLKAADSGGEDASSSSVWIPETPDVVSPAGIVNSTQLEKELMRVFANAVMFNPEVPLKRGVGPAFRTRKRTLEGTVPEEEDDPSEEEVVKGKQDVSVIKDTREIFEAVEEKVTEWRRAEKAVDEGGGLAGRLRGGGSEEVDELAGTGEDVVVGSVEQEATPEPRGKRRRR